MNEGLIMARIVVITSCEHCPYFDSFYYDHKCECTLLERVIEELSIPEDCPLAQTDEDVFDAERIIKKP
jgi:hypothetical protein